MLRTIAQRRCVVCEQWVDDSVDAAGAYARAPVEIWGADCKRQEMQGHQKKSNDCCHVSTLDADKFKSEY